MRKYFIDNIRWFSILLLFPYHTCMVYNNFGYEFYIWAGENQYLNGFIMICFPWFMPLLFTLAGIGTKYALKNVHLRNT